MWVIRRDLTRVVQTWSSLTARPCVSRPRNSCDLSWGYTALHSMIRRMVTAVAHKLFRAVGVPTKKLDLYRDVALGMPATIAVILASWPLFSAFSGDRVTLHDILTASGWFAVALIICLLSANWNEILAATWAFLSFRGVVGFVVSRGDPRVLELTAVFFVLAVASNQFGRYIKAKRLKTPKNITPPGLPHSKHSR
jgi:hypothetical protein